MAINQNHLFEELNGVKCAIVEKNVTPARVAFLKKILEINHFEVVVVPSPPPKTAPVPVAKPAVTAEGSATPIVTDSQEITDTVPQPPPAESFTVGVTDVTFNPVNAIFGRLLHTEDGHVVTLAYWQQEDSIALDDIPYFEN
jgi:hypothetical protein